MWLILGPLGAGKTTLLKKLQQDYPKLPIASVDKFIEKYGFGEGWTKVYVAAKKYPGLILESVGLYWRNEDLSVQENTKVILVMANRQTILTRIYARTNCFEKRLDEIRCTERALELLPRIYSEATIIENKEGQFEQTYERFRSTILSS